MPNIFLKPFDYGINMNTIEIGFRPAIFDGSPALHSFLVLKRAGEVVAVASGYSEKDDPFDLDGEFSGPWGYIRTETNMNATNNYDEDYLNSATYKVLAGGDVTAQWTAITSTMSAIENSNYPYLGSDFNSNSAVKTAVDAAGLTIPLFLGFPAPGLQTNLMNQPSYLKGIYDKPSFGQQLNDGAIGLIQQLNPGLNLSIFGKGNFDQCFPARTKIQLDYGDSYRINAHFPSSALSFAGSSRR